MLTLHGFSYSNYHNIVKHVLMHKGIAFEENIVYPGSPELLAVNPVAKVPAMTTERGTHLSESSVMVDFIEEQYPENPLYPTSADERAKVRQVVKIIELYLELPARRLLPASMANIAVADSTLEEVRGGLARAVRSLNVLATFKPYLMGDKVTLADIYLRYALAIPKTVGPSILNWDVFAEIPGLAQWDAMMAETAIAQKIDADREANTEDFMAYVLKVSKGK